MIKKRLSSTLVSSSVLILALSISSVYAAELTTQAVASTEANELHHGDESPSNARVSASVDEQKHAEEAPVSAESSGVNHGPPTDASHVEGVVKEEVDGHAVADKEGLGASHDILTSGPVEKPAHHAPEKTSVGEKTTTIHGTVTPHAADAEAMQRLYDRLEKKVKEAEKTQPHEKESHEHCDRPAKKKLESRPKVHWSYSGAGGPQHWGNLSPKYIVCKTGQSQSPIDLRSNYFVALDPLVFDYQRADITVTDSGHDIGFEYTPGSFVVVEGQDYQLLAGHFHLPGEHAVNGRQPDMSLHLVHKDINGDLLVVEVPFLVDRSSTAVNNPAIDVLLAHVPLNKSQKVWVPAEKFNLGYLLPVKKNRGQYYSYMGSLTTPPCTEGVRWFVMKNPLPISLGQYKLLSHLYFGTARPLQALNGRLVKSGI